MFKSYLALIIAAFLWGTSFVAGKIALTMGDVMTIVLARFAIASLILLPFAIRAWRKIDARLVGISILIIPATFLVQFVGLQFTTASNAAVIIGFEPFMVVLVGWLLWRERPTGVEIIASLLALLGVYIAIGYSADRSLVGPAIILASTVVVALWMRGSKPFFKRMSEIDFTALTITIGTLFLIPMHLLGNHDKSLNLNPQGIGAIAYLSLGCTILASLLWNYGIARTKSNMSGLFLALEPVFGVVLAALLMSEQITSMTTLGVALVFASVALPILAKARNTTPQPELAP